MGAVLIPTHKGRQIPLDKAVVFIGRHPDCDVVLTRSRKISRKHCCIAQVNDQFFVRDLGSTNGVRINGERVQIEAPLRIGDKLAIGDLVYVLEFVPKANGRRNNGRRSGAAPAAAAPPPVPLDLSQDIPVMLPDSDEFDAYAVEEPQDSPSEDEQ